MLVVTISFFLLSPNKTADAGKGIIVVAPLQIVPQVMQNIASCESHDQQFNADGTVYYGEINPLDTGKWQINQKYWLAKSQELGFNIFTLDGNTRMAMWIYEQDGTTPWDWSKPCWGKLKV